MLIEKVKKLTPLQRYLYWIKERHQIYLRREREEPKPWTDDVVLQNNFFTNPYRENDRVTKWFRDHIREPLMSDHRVLMATVIFRWFNRPETGVALMGNNQPLTSCSRYINPDGNLLFTWKEAEAVKRLQALNKKQPVFTGAFMIKVGNGPPGCKIPQVCAAITEIWKERDRLVQVCKNDCRLQALWQELKQFRGLGGFLAYEIVCDLRYTHLLSEATDVDTWANPGPGCSRGLKRLSGVPIRLAKGGMKDTDRRPPRDWQQRMQKLLKVMRKELPKMPRFEMRECEHSLCEYDKYERVLFGEGRSKRLYNGWGD